MAAGSIIVELLMRTGSFETDTKRAEKALKNLAASATRIGGAIGVALGAATVATAALFDQLVKGAAQYQDLAEMTGASAEALASYAVAAATAGVSMESVSTSMLRLTKALTGVDDESKAAGAALGALGINVADFKKLDPAAQYEAIGKALSGFEEGAGKAAVAQALWGKSGAEQLKVFKALEEQGGRTTILTQKQIELADAYADKQAKLTAELSLYAQAAATEALPALNDLTQAFSDVFKDIIGVDKATGQLAANNGIKDFAEGAADALAFVADAVQGVVVIFSRVGEFIGATGAAMVAKVKGDTAALKAIQEDYSKSLETDRFKSFAGRLEARRAQSAQAAAFVGPQPQGSGKQTLKFEGVDRGNKNKDKAAKEKTTDAERYLETLRKQIESTKDLTAVEQLLAEIQSGRLKITGKVTKDQLMAAAAAVDQAKYEEDQRSRLLEAIDAERESRIKSAEAAMADARSLEQGNKALEEEVEEMGLSVEGRLALEQARISSAIAVAKDTLATVKSTDEIGMETWAIEDQIAALEKRQALLGKRAAKDVEVDQAKKMEDEAQRARDTIENTLGQGIEDALNGNFKNIGKNWKSMLNSMVSEALAAEIMKSVFGKASGGDPLGGIMKQLGLIGGDKAAGKTRSATGGTGETGGGLLAMLGLGNKTADKASGEAGILSMFAEPAEKGAQSLGEGLVDARSEVDRFSALMPTLSSAMSEFGMASGKAGSALSLLPSIIAAVSGGGGGGSSGGGFGGLLSSFVGAMFTGGSGSGITTGDSPLSATGEMIRGRRAAGGPVSAGGAYVIGERGPEVFVPSTSGRVLPNTPATWAGGGSQRPIQVSVIQSFAPGTSRATTDQAAAQAGAAVRKATARTR